MIGEIPFLVFKLGPESASSASHWEYLDTTYGRDKSSKLRVSNLGSSKYQKVRILIQVLAKFVMDEETSNTMNTNPNHGSGQEQESSDETPRFSDLVRESSPERRPFSSEINQTMIANTIANWSPFHIGESSVTAENRRYTEPRTEKKGCSCEDESFYDCTICLHLAKDPVVTCCGHLFCWSCLYRWLNHRSGNTKCPVCNGDVTVKGVIPIYGRRHQPEVGGDSKIPARPQARNVESSMEAIGRTGHTRPWENIPRYLENRSDLIRAYQRQNWISGGTSDRAMDPIVTSRALPSELRAELMIELEEDLMRLGDVSHRVEAPPPWFAFSLERPPPFLNLRFVDRNMDVSMLDRSEDIVSSVVDVNNTVDRMDRRGRNDGSTGLNFDSRGYRGPRRGRSD